MLNQCKSVPFQHAKHLDFINRLPCAITLWHEKRTDRLNFLVIANTRALSSLSAVTHLERLGRAAARNKGGVALNQFHSPVNYNPAFLISFPHTMLFTGVQTKHEPTAIATRENKPSSFAQSGAVKNMTECTFCHTEEFRNS